MTTIINMPIHAMNKPYVVARRIGSNWYYWGAFENAGQAFDIASLLNNGMVFKTR